MKNLERTIKETTPTLAVFQHAGNQDAVEVKSLFDTLKTKYDGRANIIQVDCSYNGDMKMRYHLQEYPTWILFKEGQELMRESGRKTEAQLTDMIDRAL